MFGEVLKITIPALLVMIATIYVLRVMLKKDSENRKIQLVLQNQKLITPIRLQAYERMVLFLERISPNSIIMRLQTPNMTVQQLNKEMLILIRSEFEHNLSQQLYISVDAWEQIKIAKEKIVKLINLAAQELNPNDNAIKLSQIILEKLIEEEKSPLQQAINYLKEEISKLY
jgi:hypothetical protein